MKRNSFHISLLIPALLLIAAGQLRAQARDSYRSDTATSRLKPNFFSQGKADSLPIKYIPDNSTIPQGKMSLRNDFPYEL